MNNSNVRLMFGSFGHNFSQTTQFIQLATQLQSPLYLIQTSMEVFVQYKLQWEIQFSVNLYIVQLTSLFDCVRIPVTFLQYSKQKI